jgi:hypothetical protein
LRCCGVEVLDLIRGQHGESASHGVAGGTDEPDVGRGGGLHSTEKEHKQDGKGASREAESGDEQSSHEQSSFGRRPPGGGNSTIGQWYHAKGINHDGGMPFPLEALLVVDLPQQK